MKRKFLFLLLLLVAGVTETIQAQTISTDYTFPDYPNVAGYNGTRPTTRNCVNFFSLLSPADQPAFSNGRWIITNQITTAIQNLPAVNPSTLDVVFFPEGIYEVQQRVIIGRPNTVIKGAGSNKTTFEWLGTGGSNPFCFTVDGDDLVQGNGTNFSVTQGSNTFFGTTFPNLLSVGGWLLMTREDPPLEELCTDDNFIRQYSRISSIQNNWGSTIVTVDNPIRIGYNSAGNEAKIYAGTPTQNIGFECFRVDATRNDADSRNTGNTNQGNIRFLRAVNCWVEGVESVKAAFNHIVAEYSSNIEIKGCYIRGLHNDGPGLGYGINIMNGTGECLVENNILHNLRHSIVLQRGANGNVISHNYTFNSEDEDKSDIILHGGFPFSNLIEGNVTERIHVDTENCMNGTGNAIFRNKITKKEIKCGTVFQDGAFNLAVHANEANRCSSIRTQNPNQEWGNFYPFWCSGRGSSAGLPTSIAYNSRPAFLPATSYPAIGPGKGPSAKLPAQFRYDNSAIKTVGNNCSECIPPPAFSVSYTIDPCISSGFSTFPGIISLSFTGGTAPFTTVWAGNLTSSNVGFAQFTSPTLWSAVVTDANNVGVMVSGYTGPCIEDGFFKADPSEAEALGTFEAMAYPNPFQGSTTLRITLPEEGKVQAQLFALDGRKIRDLEMESFLPAGESEFTLPFDQLPTGMYLCKLTYGEQSIFIRLAAQ